MTAGTPDGRALVRPDEGGAARARAIALQTVRAIDAAFEHDERLRLGKWVAPGEREEKIAAFIAEALATFADAERQGSHLVERGDAGAADMAWRRLLWARHGCPTGALYGDDGELQCGACVLDFKRMTAEQIARSWMTTAQRLLAAGLDQAPARERSERDREAGAGASAAARPKVYDITGWQRRVADLEAALAAARQEAETLRRLQEDAEGQLDDLLQTRGLVAGLRRENGELRALLGAAQEALREVAGCCHELHADVNSPRYVAFERCTEEPCPMARAALAASPPPSKSLER